MASYPAKYLQVFRHDIQSILAWSEDHFGAAAADRYAGLIRQAIHDVLENPVGPGANPRPDLAPNAYVYHLRFSRDRISEQDRVKVPRHFVLYRYAGERVEFARLLHDSRDLQRHLPNDYHV
jgi:toxin ParE1/3/4